jgi:predicted DNA-binding transcriptional regulator AlpA
MPPGITPDEDDRYLRLPELVRYSSLSEKTLRRLMRDPVHPLPVHRIVGRTVVKRSEFDRWLNEHEHGQPEVNPSTADPDRLRIARQILGPDEPEPIPRRREP